MNICMVLDGEFPPDIRVEKEARTLQSHGHQIYLLSLGNKNLPEIEDVNGITVIRIDPTRNLFMGLLRSIWFAISFNNPTWRLALEDVVKQYNIDVIHCHDLPLVKTSSKVAKRYKIPIIADLHENFPEGIRAWRQEKLSLKMRIYIRYNFPYPIFIYKRLERNILSGVDRIITVVDEAKEHYIKDCKIPGEIMTVIMNTEDVKAFEDMPIDESIIEEYKDDYVISFVGYLAPHRGIETAIRSMSGIIRRIPNAKLLVIGGKGYEGYDEKLKHLCLEEKVHNYVEFVGWVKFSKVPSHIVASDICLIPHNASGHTDTTIPHKLFQYMIKEKPVIVTDCEPLKRIVEECRCGIVVPSRGHKELADAIIKLYDERQYAKQLGENGKRAVLERYNWANEGKKLIELYAKLEV